MQMTPHDFTTFSRLYEEAKYWSSFIGALWVVFKGLRWVKDIRDKDLKGIDSNVVSLKNEVQQQTSLMCGSFDKLNSTMDRGIENLRSDFRTFYTSPDPIMIPVHARASRKKASVSARAKAKQATPAKPKTPRAPKPKR